VNCELSGGGNAPDRISGVSRFCRRFVEPGRLCMIMHRIVPFRACFLTGGTLCADGRGVYLLGIWGKRKREGRSIDVSPYTENRKH